MKTSDYSTAKAILDGVDEVVAASERTWGVGRLRLLVEDDLRARWDRQWLAWCRACEAYDLAAIRTQGAAVRRAIGVLEQAARAAGHEALRPDVWEVLHEGRAVAVCRTSAEAGRPRPPCPRAGLPRRPAGAPRGLRRGPPARAPRPPA